MVEVEGQAYGIGGPDLGSPKDSGRTWGSTGGQSVRPCSASGSRRRGQGGALLHDPDEPAARHSRACGCKQLEEAGPRQGGTDSGRWPSFGCSICRFGHDDADAVPRCGSDWKGSLRRRAGSHRIELRTEVEDRLIHPPTHPGNRAHGRQGETTSGQGLSEGRPGGPSAATAIRWPIRPRRRCTSRARGAPRRIPVGSKEDWRPAEGPRGEG